MFTKKNEKCCNGGNQHKFKPRYTEQTIGKLGIEEIQFNNIDELRSLYIKKVYVCDVCIWCGNVVNKQGE